MAEKRTGLGRGLDALLPGRHVSRTLATALLPEKEVPPSVRNDTSTDGLQVPQRSGVAVAEKDALAGARMIAIDAIERNPYQTRGKIDEAALEELAASIREQGVLQPILVRQIQSQPDPSSIKYQLMAGERRWLAAQRAGLTAIPAVVKQASNEQAMEITIIENLQRQDLNPMEQARAFERLSREFGLKQDEIALKTGKERASVANFMRLLKLPAATQQHIEAGTLTLGHGKVLMMLQNEPAEMQERVATRAAESGMSVRELEELVMKLMGPPAAVLKQAREMRDPNVRAAEEMIQRALGCKASIKDRDGKGKIVLEYASLEDFDRIIEVLGGK